MLTIIALMTLVGGAFGLAFAGDSVQGLLASGAVLLVGIMALVGLVKLGPDWAAEPAKADEDAAGYVLRGKKASYAVVILAAACSLVAVAVTGRLHISDYRDDNAFRAAQQQATAAGHDYQTAARAYENYLRLWPDGRHAEDASSYHAYTSGKLLEIQARLEYERQEAALAAARSAVYVVLRTGKYDSARDGLRKALQQDPGENALLQLAFLAWGFDRFDQEAWEESEACAQRILKTYPDDQIAARLSEHNRAYRPVQPPKGANGLRAVTAYNRSATLALGHPLVLMPGQTAKFSADGTLVSVEDQSRRYTRQLAKPGWVFTDERGFEYVCTETDWPVPLRQIRERRQQVLRMQLRPPAGVERQ